MTHPPPPQELREAQTEIESWWEGSHAGVGLCRNIGVRSGQCLSVKVQGQFPRLRGPDCQGPCCTGRARASSSRPRESKGQEIREVCPCVPPGPGHKPHTSEPKSYGKQHACQRASCKHFLLPSKPRGLLKGTTVWVGTCPSLPGGVCCP